MKLETGWPRVLLPSLLLGLVGGVGCGSSSNPADAAVSDTGAGAPPDAGTGGDAVAVSEDGAAAAMDAASPAADGGLVNPDGAMVNRDGDVANPDGDPANADAAVTSCDGPGCPPACPAFSGEAAATDAAVTMGSLVYFNGGQPVPPGVYTVTYADGCMKFAPMFAWSVNANAPPDCCNWWLIGDSPADRKLELPGTTGYLDGMGGYADFDACVAANKAVPPKTFVHTGGRLGIWVQDGVDNVDMYQDNVVGVGGRNPTWRLSPPASCPPQ